MTIDEKRGIAYFPLGSPTKPRRMHSKPRDITYLPYLSRRTGNIAVSRL